MHCDVGCLVGVKTDQLFVPEIEGSLGEGTVTSTKCVMLKLCSFALCSGYAYGSIWQLCAMN